MRPHFYYQRFAAADPQIESPPQPDLGLAVVIPCFNEPNLLGALESLWNCERPSCSVEVITVVNASSAAPDSVHCQNRRTLDQAIEWIARHHDPKLQFHLLNFPSLPPKDAGVGLARKIGMDEAARRFDGIGNPDGIIGCFDADCQCDPNYLSALEGHFRTTPRSPGCSIYFEHPINPSSAASSAPTAPQVQESPGSPSIYDAIVAYELHLRYYIRALRFAGFPHAFHTVGSSMAVSVRAYKEQGGMNKRQAGEDFYFLHKIIPLQGFADLTATRVIPSPRISDRVPFGTGRAVGEFMKCGQLETYPFNAFLDLKHCFSATDALYEGSHTPEVWISSMPRPIAAFLHDQQFVSALEQIHGHTASKVSFRKRFFHWFNAFRVMKFIHFARDQFYGRAPLEPAALLLLDQLGQAPPTPTTAKQLLATYRHLDRSNHG